MNKIIEEIEKNERFSSNIKKILLEIYNDAQDTLSWDEKSKMKMRVDDVLQMMFQTAYSFSIPMEFINSPLGEFLFRIKYDIRNVVVYGISELVVLTRRSKAMIFNDYHNNKLISLNYGKRLLVTEEAAYTYLTAVGRKPLSAEEAKTRIKRFNKMITEGYALNEIQEKL